MSKLTITQDIEGLKKYFEKWEKGSISTNVFVEGKYLSDFIIYCNPTPEQREKAFKALFSFGNYSALKSHFYHDNFTIEEIIYSIKNLDPKMDYFKDICISLLRIFTKLENREERIQIFNSFNDNPDILFYLMYNLKFKEDEIEVLYQKCSKTLLNHVRRSFKNVTFYCHYFAKYLNEEERKLFIDRIFKKMDVQLTVNVLKNKDYNWSEEERDKLESLLVLNELSPIENSKKSK